MPKSKKSILKKLFRYMMSFGVLMGIIFPVYANFFVNWKEGFFVYFVIGCIMAGITVGVVSYWFVKSILIKELLKVSHVAKGIANNEISEELDIQSDDAVGEIANGFNVVLKTLNDIVSKTKSITNEVNDIGGNGNEHQQSVFSIDHLTNTIQHVKINTGSISQLSDNIRDEVLHIQTSVNQAGKDLKVLDENVDAFTKVMVTLNTQTEEINKIVQFVSEVASQTNILALNASIEASKAGEFGKSFAVVAAEVRKLSTHIAESVTQITGIVNELNKDLQLANNLNLQITNLFKGNMNNNIQFTEIIKKVDSYSDSNIQENRKLNEVIHELNNTVQNINNKFASFYNSVNHLNDSVQKYQSVS